MTLEVLIIGGGVNGLSLARELAERHGASVAVFNDRGLGTASRAAAGLLGAQIEAANLPERLRASVFPLLREGRVLHEYLDLYARDFVPLGTGYRRSGALHVALDEAELEAIEARYAWQREHGVEVVRVSPQIARRLEPSLSSSIAGAVYLPDEALVDPALLMLALRRSCQTLGVRSIEERVLRVDSGGGRVLGVRTNQRTYAADVVVMAAGGWAAGLEGLPQQFAPIKALPARTMLLRGERPLQHVVLSQRNYLVPWDNGNVALSSNADDVGAQEDALTTLYAAAAILPTIASRSVWHTRFGYRPHTPGALPWLGPTEMDGLFVMTGNVRNGLLLAPTAAALVADLVDGRSRTVVEAPLDPAHGATRPDAHGQPSLRSSAPWNRLRAAQPEPKKAWRPRPSNATPWRNATTLVDRAEADSRTTATVPAGTRRWPAG
ncbi:MAG: FAD-binding oxidoreductase [Polyangiaceae bacterium]|nr:FAD-binding oxidoreductase [Polyangiaceae bacterium]